MADLPPARPLPACDSCTGELARVNTASLTPRQWSGVDCARCGGWLSLPAGTGTRPLGRARDVLGRPHTLWAHDPPCA